MHYRNSIRPISYQFYITFAHFFTVKKLVSSASGKCAETSVVQTFTPYRSVSHYRRKHTRCNTMTSPKEKHVSGAAATAAAIRCSSARQSSQFTSTSWIDASEVQIGVDGSEHGTERRQYYENNGANEHRHQQQMPQCLSVLQQSTSTYS